MTMTTERARWFPEKPPMLPGEGNDAYTNRLTGADGTDRVPYDHHRNRQCSISWHGECTDPAGKTCKCPCHTETGKLELQVWELEESVVLLWAVGSGTLSDTGQQRPGWDKRLLIGETDTVREITARRPELADWYIRGGSLAAGVFR
jgi:hypothetical protein